MNLSKGRLFLESLNQLKMRYLKKKKNNRILLCKHFIFRCRLDNSPPRTAVLTQSVKAVYEVQCRTFVSTPQRGSSKGSLETNPLYNSGSDCQLLLTSELNPQLLGIISGPRTNQTLPACWLLPDPHCILGNILQFSQGQVMQLL